MATIRIISAKVVKLDKRKVIALAVSASRKALAAAGESYIRTTQNILKGQINRASSPMSAANINKIFKAITRTPVKDNHTIVHTGRSRGAKLREFGGVVTARNRKLLAIPLNMEAYRLQNGTITPNLIDPVPNSLYYSRVPLDFWKSKSGKMFLVKEQRKQGKNAAFNSQFMFVLQRSSRIPSRPYMRPAIQRGYPYALQAFEQTYARAMGVQG